MSSSNAGSGRDWVFLPWKTGFQEGSLSILLIVVGIIFIAVILHLIQKGWLKKAVKWEEHKQIIELCRTRKLTNGEANSIAKAMAHCTLAYPGLTLVSRFYFDRYLAMRIAALQSPEYCEALRNKLFGSFNNNLGCSTPDFPDTHAIREGKSIRCHFEGRPGNMQGLVTNNAESGITVLFPGEVERSVPFSIGQKGEVTFQAGKNIIGFQSRVREFSAKGTCTCILDHTEQIGELDRRGSVHSEVKVPVTLLHSFKADDDQAPEPASAPPSVTGIMTQVSLDGCTIHVEKRAKLSANQRVWIQSNMKEHTPFNLPGLIVGIEDSGENQHVLSIRFSGLDDPTRHELSVAIYNLKPRRR